MLFRLWDENECVLWEHNGTKYALRVERDDWPLNPRKDLDNITVMACWHRRYNLGDEKDFGDPEDFWRGLVRELVSERDILDALSNQSIGSVKVEPCEDDADLITVYEQGYDGEYYPRDYDNRYYLDDGVICALDVCDCQTLLEPYLEWMPLWLYDHSGITMCCGARSYPYNDRWDSMQVGWIVAKKSDFLNDMCEYALDENGERIKETHHHEGYPDTYSYKTRPLTEDTWRKRAVEVMESDVHAYDQYLTGDVYWFQLYELQDDEWIETDSCGGFFGDDLLKNGICDYVPGLYEAINENRAQAGRVEKHHSVSYSFAV